MSWKKITLTEDHIKLIENIKFETIGSDDQVETYYGWGINEYSIWGSSHPIDDIAMILGKFDQAYPDTVENFYGRRYPEELETYFIKLYNDIYDNMEYIISLVFSYTNRGGLTPGTYKCNPEFREWTKVE